GFSRIDVQNDRQVDKAHQDMDIGDIGHPDLIYGVCLDVFHKVRIDPESMAAVCRGNPLLLPGTIEPTFLTHDPVDFLMVDMPSLSMKLPGDSPVSVSGKLQADIINTGLQTLIGRFILPLMIKASSGQIHEFAPPLNALDKGAIFGNELSLFSVRLRLFLTALFKN